MVGQHERLKIWQKAHDLARDLMQVTERFPRPQQMNGLGSEIRQAALSLVRVQARNVRRAYKRLRQMEAGTFEGDARASIASWVGYTRHADAYGLNCQIAKHHPFLRVAFDPIEAKL